MAILRYRFTDNVGPRSQMLLKFSGGQPNSSQTS
jgi:hypothetical protein